MVLPIDVNDSPNYTPAEHADHHNEVHAFVNDHDTDPAAHTGDFVPGTVIGEVVTTAGQANAVFDAIPQTFKHLRVVWTAKGASSFGGTVVRFNDVSTATYDNVLYARWTSVGNVGGTQSEGNTELNRTSGVGDDGGSGIFDIPHYTSTLTKKMVVGTWVEFRTVSPFIEARAGASANRSTTAITKLTVGANFGGGWAAGSIFTLFGLG